MRLGRLRRGPEPAGRQAPDFPVPFVVGATRSGTTLLRLMLDAHPDLAIPYETHFIPKLIERAATGDATAEDLAEVVISHRRWRDWHLEAEEVRSAFRQIDPPNPADASRAFFRLYASHQGKPRWGDKTPGYVREMTTLQEVLPEVRFIHLIRDGRDVALSVIPRSFGPETVPDAARLWKKTIRKARRQASDLRHYMEVKFEDLVLDNEAVLRRICDFVELEFDPAMLRYYERAEERLGEKVRRPKKGRPLEGPANLASHELNKEPLRSDQLGKWRTDMSDYDRGAFEGIAGELLGELGYEVRPPTSDTGEPWRTPVERPSRGTASSA